LLSGITQMIKVNSYVSGSRQYMEVDEGPLL